MKWTEAKAQAERKAQIKAIEKALKKTNGLAPMVIIRVIGEKAASDWSARGWEIAKYPTPTIYSKGYDYLLTRPRVQVIADLETLKG